MSLLCLDWQRNSLYTCVQCGRARCRWGIMYQEPVLWRLLIPHVSVLHLDLISAEHTHCVCPTTLHSHWNTQLSALKCHPLITTWTVDNLLLTTADAGQDNVVMQSVHTVLFVLYMFMYWYLISNSIATIAAALLQQHGLMVEDEFRSSTLLSVFCDSMTLDILFTLHPSSCAALGKSIACIFTLLSRSCWSTVEWPAVV